MPFHTKKVYPFRTLNGSEGRIKFKPPILTNWMQKKTVFPAFEKLQIRSKSIEALNRNSPCEVGGRGDGNQTVTRKQSKSIQEMH